MKPLGRREFNTIAGTSDVTWDGDCINCLKINRGDNLNILVYNIASKVCELAAPLDLSSLSLTCAIDLFNKSEEVGERTLASVLQLMVDNECSLKTLIDLLQESINNSYTGDVTLDLKCLGDAGVYTAQEAFQLIVNNLCDVKEDVTTLKGKVVNLQDQINNLDIPSGDEVVVTTTISGPKVVSQALIDVSKDYTDYKSILGTSAQIQTAISRQTSILNNLMSTTIGWVNTPSTEAQLINNMMLLMNNFATRIASNELCCSSTCDDVKVGFIGAITGTTIILQFTTGAGTYIPIEYKDCGSILTISNQLGTSTGALPITVVQGGETDVIDLSMFTVGDVLNFNIDLKMCSETSTCQKCVNKDIKYMSDGCCVITNTTGAEVTLFYSTPASPASQLI